MESSATAPDSASVDDLFEVTMRGYNRRQVEDFVAKARQHVENLTAELGGTRQQRDQLMRDLTMLQEELLSVRHQLDSRPAHEEISGRMAQILRLAQEEADQERQKAQVEAQEMLDRAQAEAGETVERARAEAAELLASTRISAEQTIQAAQEQSRTVLQESQEKAEFAVGDATVRAQRLLGDAEQRTAQIVEVQDERVSTLVAVHAEAVRRLAEILDVLGGVIDQEEVAGALQEGIDPAPMPSAGVPLRPDQVEGLDAGPVPDPLPVPRTEAEEGAVAPVAVPPVEGPTAPDPAGDARADAGTEAQSPASQGGSPEPVTAPTDAAPHIAPGDMDATMLISLTPEEDAPRPASEGSVPDTNAAAAPYASGAGPHRPSAAATEVLRPSPDDGTVMRLPLPPSPGPGDVQLPTDRSPDASNPPTGPR